MFKPVEQKWVDRIIELYKSGMNFNDMGAKLKSDGYISLRVPYHNVRPSNDVMFRVLSSAGFMITRGKHKTRIHDRIARQWKHRIVQLRIEGNSVEEIREALKNEGYKHHAKPYRSAKPSSKTVCDIIRNNEPVAHNQRLSVNRYIESPAPLKLEVQKYTPFVPVKAEDPKPAVLENPITKSKDEQLIDLVLNHQNLSNADKYKILKAL